MLAKCFFSQKMRGKSEGEVLLVPYSDEAYLSVQLGTCLISHLPAFLGISLLFCSLHHFLFPNSVSLKTVDPRLFVVRYSLVYLFAGFFCGM